MNLDLTVEEMRAMQRMLDIYLPELRGEISNTEQYELREALKADEALIKSVLQKLQASLAQAR